MHTCVEILYIYNIYVYMYIYMYMCIYVYIYVYYVHTKRYLWDNYLSHSSYHNAINIVIISM